MKTSSETYTGRVAADFGTFEIIASNEHLRSVRFLGNKPGRTRSNPNTLIKDAIRQLQEYLAGRRRHFDLPLALEGTEFQKAIWSAVAAIPYGQTSSYGDIAAEAGRPKAMRAVGSAHTNNPVVIILPFHRIVRKSKTGTITYADYLQESLLTIEMKQPG